MPARIRRAHDDVAGRRKNESAAKRIALNRRDHRLCAITDGTREGGRLGFVPAHFCNRQSRKFFQIAARAEGRWRTGQHHRTDRIVTFGSGQCRSQIVHQLRPKRVTTLRAIDRDNRNCAFNIRLDHR